MAWLIKLPSLLIKGLVRGYRLLISPVLGQNCRYHPTCSAYSLMAYDKHGFLKGSFLTVTRVCSCHAWSKRPWTDPVPERFAWGDMFSYNRVAHKNGSKANNNDV